LYAVPFSLMHATCPINIILLGFITEYKLHNFSLIKKLSAASCYHISLRSLKFKKLKLFLLFPWTFLMEETDDMHLEKITTIQHNIAIFLTLETCCCNCFYAPYLLQNKMSWHSDNGVWRKGAKYESWQILQHNMTSFKEAD
jgi:hypothetical protein